MKNKLIYLILITVLSTSCLTVKRIERNCDKFAKVCITESVTKIVYRDTIIFKDRIVKIKLPSDTVRITDTITIINNRGYLPERYKEFGVIWASASVRNSVLSVRAGLIDSTILVPIKDTIRIKDAITNQTTENTATVIKKHIPKFFWFTFWYFIVTLVVLLLFGLGKFGVLGGLFDKFKKI